MKGLITLEWYYNDGYKRVFNKFYTYEISDSGSISKFETHDYRVTTNDIPCNREQAKEKLIEYFTIYTDKLIHMAKSEVVRLENKQLKELMKLRRDGLV